MPDPGHVIDASFITDELVSSLVSAQMPDLAELEIGRHYRSDDHVSVRLGDDWGLMLPLRQDMAPYVERAADLIAPHRSQWTFSSSAPVRTGTPHGEFPYPWSLVPWWEASNARIVPLTAAAARPLGLALREVHTRAPESAPANPHTSFDLNDLTPEWERLLEATSELDSWRGRRIKTDLMDALWRNAVGLDIDHPLTWTHGYLEPGSVLSAQGSFAGLALWHYFGAGNPCMDLGQAALLVPTDAREDLLATYGATSAKALDTIQGCELISALRHIETRDPYNATIAWKRLSELDLLYMP